MKKNRLLLILFLTLLTVYIALMFVKINSINLNKYWFGLVLFFIGLYSLIYFYLYGLDSSLYYATLLMLIGIVSIFKFSNIGLIKALPLYLISFAFTHLTIFVVFRQNIHFKLFAILFLQIILIVSFKTGFLNINLFIILTCTFIFLLLLNLVYRLTKNLRRR